MATEISAVAPRSLREDVHAGLIDGTCFNVMVGIGETYLGAFVLALGMGEVAAGLVTTLPIVAGALLQLTAPWGVRRLGSARRWVVLCAAVQASSFVPLVALALDARIPRGLVFLLAAWYWGAGMATSAAWNTWMGTLLPANLRPRLFAWRTRFGQLGVLAGFVAGGLLLQLGAKSGHTLDVFAVLFLIAGLCRYVSAFYLYRQSDVASAVRRERKVPLGEWLSRLRSAPDGRLLMYLLAVQCSVHISGAYFTPYMLKHLRLSYAEFTIIVASAFVAKALALPAWGSVAHRCGARRLLRYGGLGIIPLSALWLVSGNFWFLIFTQVVGGVAWAAYELAMALLFIDAIQQHERTSMLTTYNLAWSLATVSGSLLGAAVLILGDKSMAMYLTVFAASGVARIGALSLLRRVPDFHKGSISSPLIAPADRMLAVNAEPAVEGIPIPATEGVAA